jgi:dienelactone hydrolase
MPRGHKSPATITEQGFLKEIPMQRSRVFGVLAVATLFAMSTAQATLTGEAVTYQVDGNTYEGYFARNTDLGESQPVVIIIHDWDGLDDYERRRADMLAALGYAAFAVDLYGQGVRPQTLEEKKARSGALYQDREEMRSRLEGALAAVETLPGVDADERVVMGYCFGGSAVLELARSGTPAEGFVAFHGGLGTPEGQDYSGVAGPVLVLHGSADSAAPMSQVAELTQALDAAGVDHRVEIYGGAPHAFTVWGSDRYRPEADLQSWETFTEFLDTRLR